jgi:hypothetical protein
MAFVTINPLSIEVGDPIKAELFDLIKSNSDDHESRINSLETTAKRIELIEFQVSNASSASSFTGMYYLPINDTLTITNAFVTIFEKGSLTGNLEIDIKRSTTNLDDTSFTSIFTTKPKIVFSTASDYEISSNQVFSPSIINLSPGDYLRLDVTELPTNGVIGKFLVTCYGE